MFTREAQELLGTLTTRRFPFFYFCLPGSLDNWEGKGLLVACSNIFGYVSKWV